jgi:hypothetical protein
MSDSPEFPPFFSVLTDYLESLNYKYTPLPQQGRVTFTVCGHHTDYRVQFFITPAGDYFQILIHYPFRIRDQRQRLSTAELITRANYKMLLGKIEMDMADGEIRFHVSHAIEGGVFTEETLEKIYMIGLITVDRYFPAFMQHLHAGYTPEDAVFHAELDTHADDEQETPKPNAEPKAEANSKEKAKNPPSEDKPRRKRVHRKKSSGESGRDAFQGDLPI